MPATAKRARARTRRHQEQQRRAAAAIGGQIRLPLPAPPRLAETQAESSGKRTKRPQKLRRTNRRGIPSQRIKLTRGETNSSTKNESVHCARTSKDQGNKWLLSKPEMLRRMKLWRFDLARIPFGIEFAIKSRGNLAENL